MVAKQSAKRPPGRPRGFAAEAALDRAAELFWAEGYDAVDVARVARAVGVTKPSLYRLFGDKLSLFVQALRRYGTRGSHVLAAFEAEPDLAEAVRALLDTTVRAATTEGRPSGCLISCVAAMYAHRSPEVRAVCAEGLAALAETLSRRFAAESAAGRLPNGVPAEARGRLLVDVVQGLTLRARAGVSRDELLRDVQSYVEIVLH